MGRKAFFILLALVLVSAQLPAQETLTRIDTRATTANVLALTLLTALPLIVFATAEARPGLRAENTAVGVTLTIPVLVAWPLFFSEIARARKAGMPRTPATAP